MNIIFMGSPAFAVPAIQKLIDSPHKILAVYSQPPRPAGRGQQLRPTAVHALAEANGIPVYTPVSLKTPEAQAQFANHKADIAVVAAYGLLLPKAILEAYPLGCINIHPSSLPRWRGAAPIQRTLMAGDTETDICIMQMDEGLDTGDVLLREHYAIPDTFDAGQLHDVLAERGAALTLKALAAIQAGNIQPMPQAAEGVTYAKKISKDECRLDWQLSAKELANRIHGLSPAPAAFFMHAEEAIKVFCVEVLELKGAAGTVLDDQLSIACGNGALRLLEIQRPGKKRMSVAEALRGWALPVGLRVE